MILSSVLTFARTQAQTDSIGLSDANGVIFANEANLDFHRQLVTHGVDANGLSEQSILGTGAGKYNYPTNPSMLFLKAIEVDPTGTGGANYITAQQVDISNLPNVSFSKLRVNQPAYNPLFDDHGNNFEVFPTDKAGTLINVVYFTQPSMFSTTSDTINYPESYDPALLGFRIAANYCRSIKDFVTAAQFDDLYTKKVNDYIQTLGRGTQQPTQATPIQMTGWQF